MPRIDREQPGAGPLVQAFSGSGFRVDGIVYSGGVKLTPREAIAWDAPPIDELTQQAIADLLDLAPSPEFLLLGTGATLRRPARSFIDAVEARGFGIEIMDSRAAARAWGVLRAEDRWIAAALLPLDQG